MIKNVADLLARIVDRQRPALDAESIKHGTTIGAMYEGLTSHVLGHALPFSGLDLDVVSGFAEGEDGALSPELDCMVVVGAGRRVPFTEKRVYPLDQVIAAVEVKKTLHASEIKDAYDKSRKLTRLRPKLDPIPQRVVTMNFQSATGRRLPRQVDTLPEPWSSIFWTLWTETRLPARVVLGYHGYASPDAFRRAVVEDVEQRLGEPGTGPLALPTAIVSDKFAIIKGDGMPYALPVLEDGTWVVLASSNEPPLRVVLEVLWSRISARFGEAPNMFGDDLERVSHYRLLDYRVREGGWETRSYANDRTEKWQGSPSEKTLPWEPHFLTTDEFLVIKEVHDRSFVERDTPVLGMSEPSFHGALEGLARRRLIGSVPTAPSRFELITQNLIVGVMPDGRLFAGENIGGRVERWLEREVQGNPSVIDVREAR